MKSLMDLETLADLLRHRAISTDDFLTELWRLSTGHRRMARTFNARDLVLYRTRAFADPIRVKTISDISYPPADRCKLNRANAPGEQIFYASAGAITTLRESRARVGKYLIVSRWTNHSEIMMMDIGFSGDPEGIEKLYHDVFTDPDESIYPYSSRIASHLTAALQPLGLLYPSIINQNTSHNVAVKKEIVDACLDFVHAGLWSVEAITGDFAFTVKEIDFATAGSDGTLDWKGRPRKWIGPAGVDLRIRTEDLSFDAILPDGTILDPV